MESTGATVVFGCIPLCPLLITAPNMISVALGRQAGLVPRNWHSKSCIMTQLVYQDPIPQADTNFGAS